MAKIHHQTQRSQRPAKTPPSGARPEARRPGAPPAPVPDPSGKDSFIKGLAAAVYQNHPLVMLCTQPEIRAWASKIPVIKDVADAFCPAVAEPDKGPVVK